MNLSADSSPVRSSPPVSALYARVPMTDLPAATQRVLEAAARKGVELEVTFFDTSTHTADDAARALGVEVGQIVKSLVFVSEYGDGPQPCLVLASGANRVDLGLLGAVLTAPGIRRATAQEAHELTGFAIGGIPPFGHTQQIRTIMDPDLARYDIIWAAAGTANAVFPLAPNTLRILTGAVVTQISATDAPTFGNPTASISTTGA